LWAVRQLHLREKGQKLFAAKWWLVLYQISHCKHCKFETSRWNPVLSCLQYKEKTGKWSNRFIDNNRS
jgi:hypothetical protein